MFTYWMVQIKTVLMQLELYFEMHWNGVDFTRCWEVGYYCKTSKFNQILSRLAQKVWHCGSIDKL